MLNTAWIGVFRQREHLRGRATVAKSNLENFALRLKPQSGEDLRTCLFGWFH